MSHAEPHGFNVHDLWAMDRISGPKASPDGRWVVFVVAVTDMENNKQCKDLWLVGTDGGQPRRLTTHPKGSHSPQWSPDGQWVYFLSSRSDSSQVWRMRIDGGEAEQVTKLPLDVNAYRISPDGSHLALAIEVLPDCDTVQQTKDRLDEKEKKKATGRVYDRLFVRHWDSWKDGRRSHLFVMPVEGGEPVDVMKGLDVDAPTKPWGGDEEFTFAPDGKSLVYSASSAGREEAWSTRYDLYQISCEGDGERVNLTEGAGSWNTQPAFSPDGRTLAYLAMMRAGFEADRFRIMLRDWPNGQPRALTEDWDRSAGGVEWSGDGSQIYTTANHLGQQALFAVDVANGKVRTMVEHGHVAGLAVAGKSVVFSMDHLQSPAQLHAVDEAGGSSKPLTDFNAEKLANVRMGEPEQFTFRGWNDEEVHCYVVQPADFDASRKYPLAFLIHGGPQGSFGNMFHYRWNPQVYSGAGYAVVMVDFHGSTGYGQAFTDSISGHWGDRPFEDLQKGLEAALKRYPWMDGDRVAALGASYGGYMINWIAGQWPDRFRCLVNHDGDLCVRMAYFDTEELWFPEWECGGKPWEVPENYERFNPILHVDKWKTPMLVIHGAKDYRVTETHGIGTFTALQRKGIPSKLLHFPDENHWVLKPHNGVLWHETVLDWMAQWLK